MNNISIHDSNFDSTIFQAIISTGTPVEPTELAINLGLAVGIVRDRLNKLVQGGKLEVEFGRYYLADQPVEQEQEQEINNKTGTIIYLETKREDLELMQQEKIIETTIKNERDGKKAIFSKGEALKRIRDKRLYRNHYDTFDQYCEQKLRYKRDYCDKAIAAFNILENISNAYNCMDDSLKYESPYRGMESITKKACVVLPTSERQVRPLAKIQPPAQFQVWREAVEETNGKPTGKVVNRLVKEFLRAEIDEIDETFSPVPRLNRLRPGDVVRIDAQDDPQLKSFHRCWGIVDEPYEKPYYQVMTWFGTTSTVRMRQAKEIYCDRRLAKSICSKLNKLRFILKNEQHNDPGAWLVIKTLGRMHESEITDSIEELLDVLIERKSK